MKGIIRLFDIIKDDFLVRSRAQAIPTMHQMLIALRHYATGHFQNIDGDWIGVHQTTVCRITPRI